MYRSSSPPRVTTTPVTLPPPASVSSRSTRALTSSVTLGCSSAGRTPSTSASDLPWTTQGKPSQFRQRTQSLYGMFGLAQAHAAWGVERVEARRREVVRELLDARLVGDRRERVGRAGRRLGRVLAAGAVHLVQLLGHRVVRLQLVVGDRPGRRHAVVVAQLAEVLGPQAVQRGAVELRRAADVVVDLRLEGLSRARRTRCPPRRSGCRRTRPVRSSSAARAAASRRARAAGSASRTAPGGGPASRRPRRCRR